MLFLGVVAGMVWSLYDNYGYYQDAVSAVDGSRANYQNALSLSEIDRTWGIYQSDVEWANNASNLQMTYSAILGLTWLVNLIDAYFFHGIPEE